MQKISMLFVEDSEADTELAVEEIRRGGFEPFYERVETSRAMMAALKHHAWEVVISDYSMPGFGGAAALALLQERELDIPFISVSGTMGEEAAVAMMKAGAHDYIVKGNLRRLVPAIQRELEAAEVRRTQRQAEESRQLLAAIVESSDDAIFSKTLEGFVLTWNKGAENTYGYAAEEMIGHHISLLLPPDRPGELITILKKIRAGERLERFETIRVRKDGKYIPVSLTVSPIKDARGQIIGASSIARDITNRKQEETTRVRLIEQLTNALEQVKTLSGLLPICSFCKKIRNDQGYWEAVEVYVREHSNARFTHSLCPECLKREYPGVLKTG